MNTRKLTSRFPATSAAITLAVTALLSPQLTAATTITLINPSFENAAQYNGGLTGSPSLLGWHTDTESYGQTFNVVANFSSGLSGNNATQASPRFFQTSSATYVAGELYTVTLNLGRSTDLGAVSPTAGLTFGFKNDTGISFRTEGGLFVSGTTLLTIPDRTFQTFTATYTATALDAGRPVIIGVDDYYSSTAGFVLDNFTLSTTAVPEPSIAMMGAVALGLLVRRRR